MVFFGEVVRQGYDGVLGELELGLGVFEFSPILLGGVSLGACLG